MMQFRALISNLLCLFVVLSSNWSFIVFRKEKATEEYEKFERYDVRYCGACARRRHFAPFKSTTNLKAISKYSHQLEINNHLLDSNEMESAASECAGLAIYTIISVWRKFVCSSRAFFSHCFAVFLLSNAFFRNVFFLAFDASAFVPSFFCETDAREKKNGERFVYDLCVEFIFHLCVFFSSCCCRILSPHNNNLALDKQYPHVHAAIQKSL